MEDNSNSSDSKLVRGVVSRVTYRNQENGYSIIKLEDEVSGELITITGKYLEFEKGEEILVEGTEVVHPKYGIQIDVKSAYSVEPDSQAGLVRFLANSKIKGIGEKTAEKIVKAYGTDTLRIIKQERELIAKIPGVGEQKAKQLAEHLEAGSLKSQLDRLLSNAEINRGLITKLSLIHI